MANWANETSMANIRRDMTFLDMVVTISFTSAATEVFVLHGNMIDGDGSLIRRKRLVQVRAPVAQTFICAESHHEQLQH